MREYQSVLHGRDQYFRAIWCIMVAFLAADRAILPIKKYALADMDFHIAFRGSARFPSTVAERALRLGYLNNPFS